MEGHLSTCSQLGLRASLGHYRCQLWMSTPVKFALGSLHRVTAKDCWWLVDIPSSAGRVKYLQLVSIGWKTSMAIFNLSVATLAGWSCPWPWLFITLSDFLLVSLPLLFAPCAHTEQRTGRGLGRMALHLPVAWGLQNGQARKGSAWRWLSLHT